MSLFSYLNSYFLLFSLIDNVYYNFQKHVLSEGSLKVDKKPHKILIKHAKFQNQIIFIVYFSQILNQAFSFL
jgi:hypothetical protein